MRLSPVVGLAGAALLVLSAPTLAGKKDGGEGAPKYPEIQMTGIGEFDPTFTKAKAIHDSLAGVENKLKGANKGLAASLALPETTSIEDALAELNKRANNKIKVALDGRKPKLKAEDAVPEEAQKAIDTVNGMMDDLGAALEQTEQLPGEVTGLINEVKAFPGQVNLDLLKKNNIKASELGRITKTVTQNIKAIEATPERIKGVTDQTMNIFTKVSNAFPK